MFVKQIYKIICKYIIEMLTLSVEKLSILLNGNM